MTGTAIGQGGDCATPVDGQKRHEGFLLIQNHLRVELTSNRTKIHSLILKILSGPLYQFIPGKFQSQDLRIPFRRYLPTALHQMSAISQRTLMSDRARRC